jgi:stage V sporulation protein G
MGTLTHKQQEEAMGASTLEFEVKRIMRLNGQSSVKAFCDVSINGSFLLKGVKVVDGKKGLFVSMPREQGKNGQWYDTVEPLTKDAKAHLSEIVMEAYESSEEPALS